MAPWYSPPSRREISLLLFSLTTFVLFYNLVASFTTDSLRPASQQANIGAASASRNEGWDEVIYGNWSWEEGLVADNARQHAKSKTAGSASGSASANDRILDWAHDVPTTKVSKHVPGYTVMDNVFMLNGTLFIVTDDPSFPRLDSVASSAENPLAGPRPSDWQLLSSTRARQTLGSFGGLIHGVSWMVMDALPSNYTLFSLWRTYSALDTSMFPDALTLPPPRRIFYPNVPTFMGDPPDLNGPAILRQRSPSGFHPFIAKAAFPTLGLMYREDWADYALLHVPFLLKRVVIADQGAARRARTDVPPFAVPLVELGAAELWWEPIRLQVARFLGVAEQAPKNTWLSKAEAVVTYLSHQDAVHGPKLKDADHEALISALRRLGSGYRVYVVSSETSWMKRMAAIAQSTILLGVYGDHLADSVFMPPSSRATVFEIFPPGVFVRDVEVSVRALRMRYFAWWEARQYGVDRLPSVAPPMDEKKNDEVPIDVSAMVQAIRRIA